jgi:hypothetical protein
VVVYPRWSEDEEGDVFRGWVDDDLLVDHHCEWSDLLDSAQGVVDLGQLSVVATLSFAGRFRGDHLRRGHLRPRTDVPTPLCHPAMASLPRLHGRQHGVDPVQSLCLATSSPDGHLLASASRPSSSWPS